MVLSATPLPDLMAGSQSDDLYTWEYMLMLHLVQKQEVACLSRSSCFRESQLEVFRNHVDVEPLYQSLLNYKLCIEAVMHKQSINVVTYILCGNDTIHYM